MIPQQISHYEYEEQVSDMPVISSPLNWAITTLKNKVHTKYPDESADSETKTHCPQGFLPIGKIDCEQTLKELAKLITEGDRKLRCLIENYLSSEDIQTRIRASQIIGYVGCQESLDALQSRLQSERRTDVQVAIINGLGCAKLDSDVINNLSQVAKGSTHSDVRLAAIEALANQVDHSVLARSRISELLKNELDKDNCNAILRGMMR